MIPNTPIIDTPIYRKMSVISVIAPIDTYVLQSGVPLPGLILSPLIKAKTSENRER